MIRLLTSPRHHFIALAGLLILGKSKKYRWTILKHFHFYYVFNFFLAASGQASEPQEPFVENTLEPNPSSPQLYRRQIEGKCFNLLFNEICFMENCSN